MHRWRLRKASGVAQSESTGLRTGGADGTDPSPRAGRKMSGMRCPSPVSEASEKEKGAPPSTCCSVQTLREQAEERAISFTEVAESNANLSRKCSYRHTWEYRLLGPG